MPNQNIIVIGGGVGPAAGTLLHRKIIDMTNNNGTDQGHPNLIHLSFSQYIADRTKYLASSQEKELLSPGITMARVVSKACIGHIHNNSKFVIGVPCNTFHARPIFDDFRTSLLPLKADNIETLNMIELTATHIKQKFPNKEIILLSTSGTRDTGIYDQDYNGKKITICNDREQERVMEAIYNSETGVKGKSPDLAKAVETFENAIASIIKRNGTLDPSDCCVIMGCTEIPLAYAEAKPKYGYCLENFDNYIDPMDVLAKNMIVKAGYPIKESQPAHRLKSKL